MTASNFQPKILIADDDNDIRDIIAAALQAMQFTDLVLARDGKEARESLDQHEFDLLVLDVMMPHCSGVEICKNFKQGERGKITPVLIVTAKDSIQDKVGALDDGADDYITKPFNFSELQARIRALLRVREVNLVLQEKNRELQELQAELVEKERQLAVSELAGAAAHTLGQPLSAILLNLHLLCELDRSDERWKTTYNTIKADLQRSVDLVKQLKSSDANRRVAYADGMNIIDLTEK